VAGFKRSLRNSSFRKWTILRAAAGAVQASSYKAISAWAA